MQILDGKHVKDTLGQDLAKRVKALSCMPTLALLQVGNDKSSDAYIRQKMAFAESIGAKVVHMKFPKDVTQDDLLRVISDENSRETTHGIIVQLPLPAHIDKLALMNAIRPDKDVDGLSDESQKNLSIGKTGFVPATAMAVSTILEFFNIPVKGKSVAVMGRSRLVGSPAAALLSSQGANVSTIHSKTAAPADIAKAADILVVAIGKADFIGPDYVKKGAVVIDVGINVVSDEPALKRKLTGDVSQTAVAHLATAMTPVPGGVGPVTVLCLFDNLVRSAEEKCR